MVFQSYALFPHMTVMENVAYGLAGQPKSAQRDKASEGLKLVGLEGYEARLPSELSGGQQQRVACARALVLEPRVLLFDEPLSNLDAKLRRRMRDDIRELQQGLGLTVAYVTHDQQEALAVSDQIIVMSNARIAQVGAPRELYEAPRDRFVADFIGDANLIEAELGAHNGTRAPVRIGGLELELQHRGAAPGPVRVAIRPESIVLGKDHASPLKGKVSKAAYLGTHMEYTVEAPIGQLFVVDRDVAHPIAAGTDVAIQLSDHGVALVPS
jgi:iron(III) transport system ATP-binding protein